MDKKTAREIKWRLRDISEMLMQRGVGGERLYGCDEWSAPVKNINSLLNYVERQSLENPDEE